MFLQVSVILSTGGACVVAPREGACVVLFGGACVVLFGEHAWFYLGGHAWFYSGGHAWFYSGGMCGFIRGCAWFYLGGGMHGFFSFFGYNEIRSMSRWYASYWNAFLLWAAPLIFFDGHFEGQNRFTIHLPVKVSITIDIMFNLTTTLMDMVTVTLCVKRPVEFDWPGNPFTYNPKGTF